MFSILFLFTMVAYANSFDVMCYYTNWAQHRPGMGKFLPEHINPNLCTHITFAYATLNGLYLTPSEWNDETMYAQIILLKMKNPKLKIILAVGSYYIGSLSFVSIVQTVALRQMFARNAVKFLRKRQFDGFEVDWKSPDAGGSAPEDKHKFTLLMQELLRAFEYDAHNTGKPRLLLGVAVGTSKLKIDKGYEVEKLAKVVDFMNIMTYDYHGPWENVVGFNSPLYANSKEQGIEIYLNINWTVNYFVSLGAIKSKINFAISSFGRSFTLANDSITSALSPASGSGDAGKITLLSGVLAYYEVCSVIHSGGKLLRDHSQGNPYVVKDSQWIGYDDMESVKVKAQYVKKNGFGGIVFWTLDYDDFSGTSCNQGMYPLLSTAYNSLHHQAVSHGPKRSKLPRQAPPVKTKDNFSKDFRVVCYYTNWSQYRPGKGVFWPENIDPALCTHICYAFAKPVGLTIEVFEWNDDYLFQRIMKLRDKNPELKILLSIGGNTMGSEPFRALIESDDSRKRFARNAASFLRNKDFDGLDMHWIYPTNKTSFQLLIEDIKSAFEVDASKRVKTRLLLSVAVAADKKTIDNSYDVPRLAKSTDFINVMSYDYHTSEEKTVAFNALLYSFNEATPEAKNKSVNWTMQYYVSLGAPKKKLNLGITSYGRSFILSSPEQYDIDAPSTGAGFFAPFTQVNGIMAYYEVCDFISAGANRKHVNLDINPYAFNFTTWVGYEDVESVSKKACYASQNEYGGVMFWSLDYDDFSGGTCNEGKYPLLNAVYTRGKTKVGCTMFRSRKHCRLLEKSLEDTLKDLISDFIAFYTSSVPENIAVY